MTDRSSRPAKRKKVAVRVSHGVAPKEFLDKHSIFFDIHNFADLPQKRDECITSKIIKACGNSWRLRVYPRGDSNCTYDTEYVCIYLYYNPLYYCGERAENNPVDAKLTFRTKTQEEHLANNFKFSKDTTDGWGTYEFEKRENIMNNELDKHGTLTIEVEIRVGTEKRTVWYPRIMNKNDIGAQLYQSLEETSDVTFIVGTSRKEIKAHKNILAIRAKFLYDLIIIEQQSSSFSKGDDIMIDLPDIDPNVFEIMLHFFYCNQLPDFDNVNNDNDASAKAKKNLLVADQLNCTDLKLYMESTLVEKFLSPSNCAELLLLGDSHSCPLLKESCMNTYISDSDGVKQSKVDWNRLKESSDLLEELLDYAIFGRNNKYSSVIDDGDGTVNDADDFDVTSLRERLDKYDLNMDGSKEILLQRWKDHLS